MKDKLLAAAQTAFEQKKVDDVKRQEQAEINAQKETAEQTQKTIERFREKFGFDVTGMAIGHIVSFDDGITMYRPKFPHNSWNIEKRCANFNAETDDEHKYAVNGHIDSLGDLGEFIEKSKDINICYNCEKAEIIAQQPPVEVAKTPVANAGAFPARSRWEPAHEGYDLQETGLTKREYFAAKALQGILAGAIQNEVLPNNFYVETAVKMADGLIAELEEMPSPFGKAENDCPSTKLPF